MNKLLSKQLRLQQDLGECRIYTCNGHLCDDIRDISYFLNREVVELIDEIGGPNICKPWKVNYSAAYITPTEITPAVRSEAIDMLKFALNICLKAGITPENLDEEFDKVHEKNLRRIKNGY